MNIFLFVGLISIFTFVAGRFLEKFRVPWVFAALIFGALLAFLGNPFEEIISSETFQFLAQLGMYFLLFLIGLELDIDKLRKKKAFIFKSTVFIIFLEGLLGSLLIHYVFNYDWAVSALVALSFATVGEAILIPILQEFKMVNTSLGQLILGIGSADDVIEVVLLILVSVFVGAQIGANVVVIFGALAALFLLLAGLIKLKPEQEKFKFKNIETLFLFVLFVFFLFTGVGFYAEAAPVAALLAGIGIRVFLPRKRLEAMESEIKTMTYGFFTPLFFVWVGSELDIKYLTTFPLLVLLVVVVSNGGKLLASFIAARKELGGKGSLLLGMGLSVRFSTSIIIVKFLFDNNVIDTDLFSVIVASSIIFGFIFPLILPGMLSRWKGADKAAQTAR